MNLRGSIAFIGEGTKSNSVRMQHDGRDLVLTTSWRAMLLPVAMTFVFGPGIWIYGLAMWWMGKLPPIEKFPLFPGIPALLMFSVATVAFVHQLTRQRTIRFDVGRLWIEFIAKDWWRTSAHTIPFSAVRALLSEALVRPRSDDDTTAKANLLHVYIVAVMLNDGSLFKLFETTNPQTVTDLARWIDSQPAIGVRFDSPSPVNAAPVTS